MWKKETQFSFQIDFRPDSEGSANVEPEVPFDLIRPHYNAMEVFSVSCPDMQWWEEGSC